MSGATTVGIVGRQLPQKLLSMDSDPTAKSHMKQVEPVAEMTHLYASGYVKKSSSLSGVSRVSKVSIHCSLNCIIVGTEDAVAAESVALNALKPQQTGAERLTGCEKARNGTGMPAGADTSLPPETETGVLVIGVTGLQTDMRGPTETEVLIEGMAEIVGTGHDPRTEIIGEGLTATERMWICTALGIDPSARKQRSRRQTLLTLPAAPFKLRLTQR